MPVTNLVDEATVIDAIDGSADLDASRISLHISLALNRHIRPLLGNDLYYALLQDFSAADTPTANEYADLWLYGLLRDAACTAVWLEASATLWADIASAGIIRHRAQDGAPYESLTGRDVATYRQSIENRLSSLLDQVRDMLRSDEWYNPRTGAVQDNTEIYTLYPDNCKSEDGGIFQRTGIVFPPKKRTNKNYGDDWY